MRHNFNEPNDLAELSRVAPSIISVVGVFDKFGALSFIVVFPSLSVRSLFISLKFCPLCAVRSADIPRNRTPEAPALGARAVMPVGALDGSR